MRSYLRLAALAVVLVTGVAKAADNDMVSFYMNGEDLTSNCRKFVLRQNKNMTVQDLQGSGMCYGFVEGVLDAISFDALSISPVPGINRLCIPPGLNANTAAEIVGKFGDAHPELRTLAGYPLVRLALANAFPCR